MECVWEYYKIKIKIICIGACATGFRERISLVLGWPLLMDNIMGMVRGNTVQTSALAGADLHTELVAICLTVCADGIPCEFSLMLIKHTFEFY